MEIHNDPTPESNLPISAANRRSRVSKRLGLDRYRSSHITTLPLVQEAEQIRAVVFIE
jgi:hypothetical protein